MLMLCWGNHHHGVNALSVLIVVGSGAALNGCSDWDASLGAHRTLIVALEQRIGGASDDDFEIVGSHFSPVQQLDREEEHPRLPVRLSGPSSTL